MTEPTIEEMQELMQPTEAERIIDVEHEEVTGTDIEVRPDRTLFRTDDPNEMLTRATETADALKRVIVDKRLFKKIGEKDHVFVEGWTLLGSMLGVFPVLVWSRRIDETNIAPSDRAHGFEARVEARTIAGNVVGAAEAQCTRKESRWKSADDYAIRSMAQTRATSKALRQPLGFVMTLAGFDPTPTEEMPANEHTAAPAASEVLADKGQIEEVSGLIKMLEADFPMDNPDGYNWTKQAQGYCRDNFDKHTMVSLSKVEINQLRETLEDWHREQVSVKEIGF